MQHRLQSTMAVAVRQLQKTSLVAKAFSCVVVLFYALSYIPAVEDNLALTPAYIVPPQVKVWTLLTATFYERRIVFVVLDIIAIVGFSTVLEPLWNLKEYLIFSAVVSVTSLLSCAMTAVLLYAITQSFSCLFTPYHGLVALVCGYVVAVKQFHPDSVTFPPPAPPNLRVKHLPLVIILVGVTLSAVGVVSYTFILLSLSGTLSSWVYLRFYQKREQGGRGDMAESFAFATFFPEPIQVLVTIKVCPKAVRTYDVGAASTIRLTLPGTDPVDAQRRKQRALKALDERMNKVGQPLTWPSLDDASSSQDEQPTPASHSHPPPHLEAVVVESSPPLPAQPEIKPSVASSTSPPPAKSSTKTDSS